MTNRGMGPDFEDPAEKARKPRGRSSWGMRPAFAGVAMPMLVALLAASNGLAYLQTPPTLRRPPLRQRAFPVLPMRDRVPPSIDPRMVVPAPAGIDEAMIKQANSDIDPRMVVPAFPTVEAVPTPIPYNPLWGVPAPPTPGFRVPGGTTPRR